LDKDHPSWADFEPVLNYWICWWFHMLTRADVYLNIVVVRSTNAVYYHRTYVLAQFMYVTLN
jgi:hypothetical protein